MIVKEWLEDIKERFVKYQTNYNLNGEDVEWLIQQTGRIEELEYAVRKIDVVIDHHRLIKRKEADELADCIVEIISDLEEKVGEIT
mgnify:CR=1 FL=1